MLTAGRDYMVFERNARAGSFFEKFPIHRKLISLNKRNTGRDNPEFNLRHDWNSLLGNPDCVPVTNRTTERFPHADTLVEYLRDFARPQETAGRIQYGTEVQNIDRSSDGLGFTMDVRNAAPRRDRSVHCDVLIMANGLWTVNKPAIDGVELMTGYESLPSTGEFMEAKSVAIFGMGNSAFEVANAAADYVSPNRCEDVICRSPAMSTIRRSPAPVPLPYSAHE
jgi:cation diffusion facilitator CzcD-associated flavoprotein CzcO